MRRKAMSTATGVMCTALLLWGVVPAAGAAGAPPERQVSDESEVSNDPAVADCGPLTINRNWSGSDARWFIECDGGQSAYVTTHCKPFPLAPIGWTHTSLVSLNIGNNYGDTTCTAGWVNKVTWEPVDFD